MFNIKYISGDYVQTTGSALLKMMQNNAMPVLDLFVRESIQNSLDAVLPGKDKVIIDYQIGSFDKKGFAEYYLDIKDEIFSKFPENKYKFLAIRDSNTIGLVGNRNGKFKKDGSKQNLGKLVFQIMHPQDQEGAGGSWGIGKTIYYRLGQGFTIFYSRILLEDGQYEHRLVSSLVENEDLESSILRKYTDGIGIAFFGNVETINGKEDISVIVNEEEIKEFLSMFGIVPFKDDETGTMVIIPFINERRLLEDNKEEKREFETEPYWYNSLEEYLRVSIYRWYFPRLCNKYPYGAYLEARVNGIPLKLENHDYVYKKFTQMYETLLENESSEDVKVELIERQRDVSSKELGKFVYCKVSRTELGMNVGAMPSPFAYANVNDVGGDDYNPPIICFIRKPGMIISYKTSGDWAGNGISCSEDEFILGLFVLNSTNKMRASGISLEEYIRKSERSDHIEWVDHALENSKKIDIVKSITRGITGILRKEYSNKTEETTQATSNRVFGKRFAKLLLSDHNFGNESSSDNRGRTTISVGKTKMTKVNLISDYVFDEDGMSLKFNISSKGKCKSISFIPEIATSNGYVTLEDWISKSEMKPCFEIDYIFASLTKLDAKQICVNKRMGEDSVLVNDDISFSFIKQGDFVVKIMLNNNEKLFEMNVAIRMKIYDRNTSFVIKTSIEEE